MIHISVLTPTRGRCEDAKEFAQTVLETAYKPEEVEIIFYVDNDDPQLECYRHFGMWAGKNVKIRFGEPMSISKSWNIIADLSSGDILIMGNDDLRYKTPEWDRILDKHLEKYSDQIYLAWFNDLINGELHCAFPIVSRRWYDTLGYFTPGIFEFLCNDTWLFDIGQMLGRLEYIDEVVAEHLHFSTGKMKADETTLRHRRSGATKRDLELFSKKGNVRFLEAQKLIRIMEDDNI